MSLRPAGSHLEIQAHASAKRTRALSAGQRSQRVRSPSQDQDIVSSCSLMQGRKWCPGADSNRHAREGAGF